MYIVYAVFVHVAFLLLLPVLLVHPKLREGFLFRLGFYPRGWPGRQEPARGHDASRRPVFWFHGASAGDLLALQPVLPKLRQRRPDAFVVVTTITNSGMALRRRMEGADAFGYLPYDLPWAIRRAVNAIRPDVLVLEYAEVWPALIRGVKRHGARIAIINGRFNESALSRYRWFYRLVGNPLRHVDLLCMRDKQEAEHAMSIGADPDKVRVMGNTKFDSCKIENSFADDDLAELTRALGADRSGPLWLAGSTHEGEEDKLLDVFRALRERFADLRLVLAPRYIERAERVVTLAGEHGFACALRSRGADGEPVVVLDSVGELRYAYRLATVVVVGGSFIRRGGQNILEPAACGKPVLFGPHMENFRGSVRVLIGRGGIQVPDYRRLQRVMTDLLSSPEEIDKLGRMAHEAVSSVQGASSAVTQAVLDLAGEQLQ